MIPTMDFGFAPILGTGHGDALIKTLSRSVAHSPSSQETESLDDESISEKPISKADDWKLMPEVKGIRDQRESDHLKGRRLGVTWNHLTVKGIRADATINENVLSQFNIIERLKSARRPAPLKIIIDESHGCVKPGEMLLVLGRPGAGCTTLLKMLANQRQGYQEVTGEVSFGSLDAKDAQHYRGQIIMNTEDELFFPTLTVGQTMDFATRMKIPFHLPSNMHKAKEFQTMSRDFLLRSMGIEHTYNTKVGNAFVRGVSGGERKRVSIIETLATRGSVFCWDNSTRGLDASTAVEWARAIRALTDIFGLASIVTLYQAGNGIFDLFDKVLILDEGKELFYGPTEEARPFMESLGFICTPGANVADFLTGVTVPTERQVRPGFENDYPRTNNDVRLAYELTAVKAMMEKEYIYPASEEAKRNTTDFQESVMYEKDKTLLNRSPQTVSFFKQVKATVIRQYQLLWGDRSTLFIKQATVVTQALIAGSLFYNAPNNSSGLFLKSGALFFSLLYNTLLAMSEVTDSFSARGVLAKHRQLALYHPAAFCVGQIATDIPLKIMQISMFSLPVYWMVGLQQNVASFYTYWITVFSVTMTMTAAFRATGAAFRTFDAASKASGLLLIALVVYTGYMIPKPLFHPWFGWLYHVDPLAYGFEALLANEFGGSTIPCVDNNLVPIGPAYTNPSYQACAGVTGAASGAHSLTGDEYLRGLEYDPNSIWRNVGLTWAWWAGLTALTIFFTSRWSQVSGNSGALVIPREKANRKQRMMYDEESQNTSSSQGLELKSDKDDSHRHGDSQLVQNTSVFTWKNLTYTVKTPSGDRVLLDNVQGWVKPGMLAALMGSSGAGKTTLLDVLAQRKTEGTIKGSILVDGRPLPLSFQRSAGYCEQQDVHEPLATVREALEFSALLRQSRATPRAEKLKYVDTIIDLLEMHDMEHTLIGTGTAGLSIEQRKRLTIGVELVSKPSILIFLDEPTSGLDGQSAFNTVRFLRKLADAGQAVLVTIHQPSASLFEQFDTLLLLSRGGKTVYFGEIGDHAQTLKDYFGRHGAPCPEDSNPAEHMIDVVGGSLSQGRDWNQIWQASKEHAAMLEELDRINEDAASRPSGTVDDGREFATSKWDQIKLVTKRMNVALFRNTGYVNNKFMLHIVSALFNGFTFWKIGNSVQDLQLRLFTVFMFIFVAPGVIAQLQPLFIHRRDIYETREKKSKMYHWSSFVTGLIVSELPYLVVCAVLYFLCWYYTVGSSADSSKAGPVFLVMLLYEFIYTGIGQAIAAYAPNAVFATLINPLCIGMLTMFCGVLVPYSQINVFWRYWLYYINPFTYLMGSLLTFTVSDTVVQCKESEFAVFDTPGGITCGEYLSEYLQTYGAGANLVNANATSGCKVCQYRYGSDYLYLINLKHYSYGWRDVGIVAVFAVSCYSFVYILMKLRTKASKKAE